MSWAGCGSGLYAHPLQEGALELRWARIRIHNPKLG
jgi:hypothetical protein